MKQSLIVLTILLFACKQPALKQPDTNYVFLNPDTLPAYDFHEKMIYDWGTDTIDNITCALYRNKGNYLSVHINNIPLKMTDTIGEVKPERLITFTYHNKRYLLIRLAKYNGCLIEEINGLVVDPGSRQHWMAHVIGPYLPITALLDSIK